MTIKITVVRKIEHVDLKEKYENPITHTCDLEEGMVFYSQNGLKPENFCDSAWGSIKEFVERLAKGEENFYDGWMKNPRSAMISCNDGFRPVSFLIEAMDEEVSEIINNEEDTIKTVNNNDSLIDVEATKELFIKEKEEEALQYAKHERFVAFKKAFNRAGLNILIFFGILQIVCGLFMYIGMGVAAVLDLDTIDINSLSDLLQGNLMTEHSYLTGIFYIIGYIITIVLTIIINKKIVYGKDKDVETNIRKLSFGEIMLMLSISFGLWGVGVLVGNLPEFIGFGLEDSSVEMIFGDNYLLYAFMAIFGAPFIEELVCRKFFIDKTASKGESLAVLVSALFFGLMHANSGQFFLAFNLGLVMGVIYVKTRNILYTMLIHFCINFWGTVTIFTEMIFKDNEKMYYLCEDIWSYATIALSVVGVIMAIIFVFIKKKELFIPKTNNEFDGNKIFKTPGIKIFFIVTVVLTGLQDALSVVAYLLLNDSYMLIGALIQLFIEGLFATTVILVRVYIKNKMYPRIKID